MANKRLRDWPIIVRKYDVSPIGDVPKVVFDTARQMQKLWNELVRLHDALLVQTDGLDKEAIKPLFAAFNQSRKELTGGFPGLDTYQKWDVYGRFDESLKRFYSGKADRPTEHTGLRRINIPFADRDGGKEINWLFRSKSRIKLREVPEEAYNLETRDYRRMRGSRGHFTVQGVEVPFQVNIHRPIPDNALLKRVNFCGDLVRPFGWRWSIVFTLEVPELPKSRQTGRACAIDLGWRNMGDYLRVGTVTDSNGNRFEMRLPFNLNSSKERAVIKFLESRKKRGRVGFDLLPEVSIQREGQIQSMWSLRLEQVKTAIKPILGQIPEDLRPAKAGYHMLGNGRVLSIYYQMERQFKEGVLAGDRPQILDILQAWAEESKVFHRRLTHCRESYLKARDWYYGNLAAWLAETYDIIAWEGDLDLKEMSEVQGKNAATKAEKHALDESQKYRKFACLYDLRLKIEHSVRKRGKELTKMKTAYSSSVCAICGSTIVTSKLHLEVKCKKGHAVDQDLNTTEYFLQQLLPDYNRNAFAGDAPAIWQELEKIVVPLPRKVVARVTG